MRFRSSLVRLAWLIAMVFVFCQAALAGTCSDAAVATSLAAGSLPNSVRLEKGTTGQPLGGTLVFTVPTNVLSKDGPQLVACFRMRPRDQHAADVLRKANRDHDQWSENVPLRVLDSKSDVTTVSVEVPRGVSGFKGSGSPSRQYYAFDGLWPLADFRVLVPAAIDKAPAVLDEIIPFSITSYWISAVAAVAGTLAFWVVMRILARKRKIPGGFILGVIANQNGYASLSQLQIMLWTIVIGAASIYIVVLTGRLLDIPTPTLALLGIAGAASVAASVPKADGDGQAAPTAPRAAPAPIAPGAVTDLRIAGGQGNTSVVLSWGPPDGGGTPTTYAVQQRTAPLGLALGAWADATNGNPVREAPFQIINLTPNTRYQFRVTASNAGVAGPPTETDTVTTLGAAGAAAPAQPQAMRPGAGAPGSDRATIEWNPLVPAPDAYVIRVRLAGTTIWTVAGVCGPNATSLVVDDLVADADHEFQVAAVADGQIGPASAIATARTEIRTPQIMDLVVWDGSHEIDVTRLQMLFFTLVAAMFVSIKVVALNEVPEIPQGLLLLMGLSNGVYLSSKFVTGRR